MRKRIKWTPEMVNSAVEMLRAGENWSSIATAFGCSVFAVRARLIRDGEGTRWSERNVSIGMDLETWNSLKESASARGKCVGEMMSDVAAMMADSVLLDNVLDDGVSC